MQQTHRQNHSMISSLLVFMAILLISSMMLSRCANSSPHSQGARSATRVQARASQTYAQQQLQAYNERQAWYKAHPRQVAEFRHKYFSPSGSENSSSSIVSSPFATRLSHAKKEFDELAGNHGVFASATILHTYIKDNKIVIMVDQAGWDTASQAERDAYLQTIDKDWLKSCTDNQACDPDNINSSDTSKSLGYLFTSYFDSH